MSPAPAPLRRVFRRMLHDPPGERFVRHYERRRHRGAEHPVRHYGFLALGLLLVITGLVMLVTPGPGILVILVGLTLVAARSRRIAGALDRSESALRARIPHRQRRQ